MNWESRVESGWEEQLYPDDEDEEVVEGYTTE